MKSFLISVLTIVPLFTFGNCIKNVTLDIGSTQTGTLCPNGTVTTQIITHGAFRVKASFTGTSQNAQGTVIITPGIQVNITSGVSQLQLNGANTVTSKWTIYTGPNPNGLIYKNESNEEVKFVLYRWEYAMSH